jgi:hypothetical protein
VRVAQTSASTLTDDDGHYSLAISPGEVRLEVRRIGYRPAFVSVLARETSTHCDIYVHRIPAELAPVIVTAADDPASRIVAAAIARKHALFATIHDYRYDAYVKLVVRDVARPSDSASSILLISETRTAAYWEQPGHYQETIRARRQSSNLDAERNLVTVGEIVNFHRNRIDLGRYSLVSPIADDALDNYVYHIIDTLPAGGRRTVRLAIQPRTDAVPLFAGIIDIADSTYDVLGVDVGVNTAVRLGLLRNLRYRQRLADVGDGRWMPVEIRLTGEIRTRLPIPGIPRHLAFEHAAALDGFHFNAGEPPSNLAEVRIVVRDDADRRDSTIWSAPRAIPLTNAEQTAWSRIDSLGRLPPTMRDRVRQGAATAIWLATNPDFFHYNRVDGAYAGAAWTWRQMQPATIDAKLGYATSSETWQYRVGARFLLSDTHELWVGGMYHDETINRPTLIGRPHNPTFSALLRHTDPLDYYREHGATMSTGARLFAFTRLVLGYNDLGQSSLGATTDYALFPTRQSQRPNPPIVDGTVRSVSANVTYDSRPLLSRDGRLFQLPSPTWTRLTVTTEVALPALSSDGLDFRTYSIQLERRQRLPNLGLTTINAAAGIATGTVPPQRYFAVDAQVQALTFEGGGLHTLGDSTFSGNRAAMITVRHDFDRLLFARSGLPLIRELPFTFSVHAAIFWTRFVDHGAIPGDALLHTAPTAYREAGFGVGNLTPFLAPLNVEARCTWQLSAYRTRRSQFGVFFTRP